MTLPVSPKKIEFSNSTMLRALSTLHPKMMSVRELFVMNASNHSTPPRHPPYLNAPAESDISLKNARLSDEFMRGGCFSVSNTVSKRSEGSFHTVPISAVKKGDVLKTYGGGYSEVICVLHLPSKFDFVRIANLEITPWHPVYINRKWNFPFHIEDSTLSVNHNDYVINFVMKEVFGDVHRVLVSGIPCVTLGHGYTENIVRHDFWGRDVINHLKQFSDWKHGEIKIKC